MFRRTFTTKSSNPVKSSEWRGLRSRLVAQFPLLEAHLASVGKVSAERVTFATEKYISALYWDMADTSLVAVNPVEGVIMPSLTTCWRAPDCIPVFLTPAVVMEKIMQAADLMAPGIFGNIPLVKAGDVVGIATLGNPRTVLALGIALMDGEKVATERKGKAVRVIHFIGDNLWEKCGKPHPPVIPKTVEAADTDAASESQDDADAEVAEMLGAASLADASAAAPDAAEPEPEPAAPSPAAAAAPAWTEDQVKEAFLRAVVDMAGAEFPLSGSTAHSKYLKPHAPGLDFKNTKWKKLAKFLKAAEKELDGVVAVKDLRGEPHIMSVNLKHPLLADIIAERGLKKRGASGAKGGGSAASSSGGKGAPPRGGSNSNSSNNKSSASAPPSSSSGPSGVAAAAAAGDAQATKFVVTPMYQPTSSLSFVFPQRDVYLTKPEVGQALEAYFAAEELVNPRNGRMIRLNPHLAKYSKVPDGQREDKRDELFANVLAAMRVSHKIRDPRTGHEELRRGAFVRVLIATEWRQGRKVVTVIKHLGNLGFHLPDLQSEFSTKCASSVSVDGPVLLVQGDQTKFLKKWVMDVGINHLVDFKS
ncbi:hypothetical protein H9P43_004542 [Blastocladiella emersonii ATCC 22665]|nr:hypothetical protein H9P43_004542 [Blastocladiella emersonii ATCC 22665]